MARAARYLAALVLINSAVVLPEALQPTARAGTAPLPYPTRSSASTSALAARSSPTASSM
ncbi:hypothetical protein [Streptomyces gilvosporeus]|uniref:hypothetical protein n=1 Tax=Streptomyces gilvosporeus TaxID=553510 RepID=UPI00131CAEDB|nr:hypothetical protein [Streptomyces gilvosporeus]